MENEITAILNNRSVTSDMANVMQVLGYGPGQFQKAFDIALEMENRNLVKLLYSNYSANTIIVEFTLLGKK